ncbi:MAG TPA: MraY family glycosyltransferase [Ktedonobacterales bacterium]|jgi:UDP-GlcNAc:undecaprenyl-phosphate GlcNAc-1-phosphate transferase|nr:MraY family glycosyltransferase [Ktedonobacterales bacterium]
MLESLLARAGVSASWLTLALGLATATLIAWGLSVIVARASRRYGLLDLPGGRHSHTKAAPRLGGIAIFLAFALATMLLYHPSSLYEAHVALGLFLAATLTVAVMAIDDVHGLKPWVRLLAQTVAAALVIYPGVHGMIIEVIHNPLSSGAHAIVPLPLWIALPFTWFWIVGMMNTINWVDGVDGLAGGVVAIAAIVMAAISWILGQTSVALLCAILAGATLGFLLLNWRPGKLFMGDSGAMFLGLALATLAGVGGAKLATMLLLLGLPILDAARVIVRRVRHGHAPTHADRSHLHHRLLATGLSERQVALLFYAVTGAFGAVTILAAYLQAHAWRWSAFFHLTPWLNVAATEAPTIFGLTLVPVVTLTLWRLIRRRRERLGLPPESSNASAPLPPRPVVLTNSSSRHLRP